MSRDISPSPQWRVPGYETTDAPDSVAHDYLRKRHASEGPSRRRVKHHQRDPALAALSDAALDDRNSRVWAVVQESCQVALGLDPVARPNLCARATVRDIFLATAQKAALCICRHRYGIPPARLGEITSSGQGWISNVTRQNNPDVQALIKRWEDSGGPSRVASAAVLTTVQISGEAAAALASLTDGEDPVSFLSDLILSQTK